MKHKPKNLSSRNPHGRLGKGILHLFRLGGFSLILIILLALFHLLTLGLPGPLTRRITAHLQQNGLPIRIDSITLSSHHGWVLHNVQLYSTQPDDLSPLFQTAKLYLNIWPVNWTSLSKMEWNISLQSKHIKTSLGLLWEKTLPTGDPFRTINRMKAHLHTGPAGLTVVNAEADWGGYILRAAGRAAFSGQKQTMATSGFRETLQTRVPQIAELLAGLEFNEPPEINIEFDLPAGGLKQAQLDATLFGSGLQRKGRSYDHIAGALHLSDGEVHVDSLQVATQNHEQLNLSGLYNLSSKTAQLDVKNSLRIEELLALLPESAAAGMAQHGLQPFGAMEFDATLGPCPLKQLPEHLRMQMRNLQIRHEELTFDPLQFDLVRDGSRLTIEKMKARSGDASLTGEMEMNMASGAWRVSAQGRVPTEPIGKLLHGTAREWVERVAFTNDFPDIKMELSRGGKNEGLQMNSSVSGRDVLCAGVPLDTLDLTMVYSNRLFSLSRLEAARGDQKFSGTVRIDLDRKRAFFNATSGLVPSEIAQIIAPDHPTVLTNFTFTGPLSATASGQIDYSGGTNHAVQGSLSATTVSAAGLSADEFQSRIEARGDELIFSNTSMKLFDGVVQGSAVFDLQLNDGKSPYRLDLDATGLSLNQIARHISTNDHRNTKGQVSVTADITADATAGLWASANGKGTLKIKNGQLHDLPVLGGFSRLLRNTLPDFSLFSITTLYSEYELRDGALHTDNLQLGSTLISARGSGTYSLEKGLDFVLKAEPLRQTRENKEWYQLHLWGADALKQGTAPLFSLLEFKLTGSLDQPDWRLVNLPKEVSTLLKRPIDAAKELLPGNKPKP